MSLAIFNCHQFCMGWLHILIKYYVILSITNMNDNSYIVSTYDNLITIHEIMYYFYFSLYLYMTYYCINYCIEEQRKYVLIFLAFNVLYCSILFMSLKVIKIHKHIPEYMEVFFYYLPLKMVKVQKMNVDLSHFNNNNTFLYWLMIGYVY